MHHACLLKLRHRLATPALARRLGAAGRCAVLALMVVVVVLQGFELSMQRGGGRAHVHVAQAAEAFALLDDDHEQAHARGLAHDHPGAEAGVLYLDEDHQDPAPSNPRQRACDLDKLLSSAAPRPLSIAPEPCRVDAPLRIRSAVVEPAQRPPAA